MDSGLTYLLDEIHLFLQLQEQKDIHTYEQLHYIKGKMTSPYYWLNNEEDLTETFKKYGIYIIKADYDESYRGSKDYFFTIRICFEKNGFITITAENLSFAMNQLQVIIENYYKNFIQNTNSED